MSLKQTIKQYYDMVNLQIAAEAMWDNKDRWTDKQGNTGDWKDNIDDQKVSSEILAGGNFRSTKFANEAEAKAFLEKYEIVEHSPNTDSGFSGTLFQDKITKEYIISFRSTEFIEDHIRDSAGTNQTIKNHGIKSPTTSTSRQLGHIMAPTRKWMIVG